MVLAVGYEDLNDHEALRRDTLVAVVVDKADPAPSARLLRGLQGRPIRRSAFLRSRFGRQRRPAHGNRQRGEARRRHFSVGVVRAAVNARGMLTDRPGQTY